MYFMRKLHPPKMSTDTIIMLGLLPLIILLFVFAGYRATFAFIAFLELIFAAVQVGLFLRTRNIYFIWMAVALAMIFIFALALSIFGLEEARERARPLSLLVIMALGIVIYLITGKKVKWRTREVLELSAMPVSGMENGFTERPLVAGRAEGTELEIESFAAFVRENQIAIPYFEDGALILSLTSNYWKQIGFKNGYEDESWVRFDRNGQVTASISKDHYLNFKGHLSFDQLCQSLGTLFIKFFELYKKGQGKQVIDQCNNLHLNPFIE